MSYKVTASDIGAVQLNETDTVRSVLQNIAIYPFHAGRGPVRCIAASVFLRFVDKPLPVAMPMMYSEVKEAVEEYEPAPRW